MRINSFITHSAEVRHILNHVGGAVEPAHITPARGPPLWEGRDAPVDDGVQSEPDWDLAAQPAPRLRVGPARQLVTEQDGGINRCGESLRARQP